MVGNSFISQLAGAKVSRMSQAYSQAVSLGDSSIVLLKVLHMNLSQNQAKPNVNPHGSCI